MKWGQLKKQLQNVSDDLEMFVSLGNPLVSNEFEVEEVLVSDDGVHLLVFTEDDFSFKGEQNDL